ncbi:uncharacterized protein TNCV_597991 [Trichonephila clavipes]|nr:uncharacterized protein TNCV_597991 [Trichonephila clavipes]
MSVKATRPIAMASAHDRYLSISAPRYQRAMDLQFPLDLAVVPWERVAWSDESRFVIHPADGRVSIRRHLGEQLLPQCTVGHTQAGSGGIMLWGDVLLSDSWTCGCSRADNECYRISENDCGPVAPSHGLCFSSWKWNNPLDNAPCQKSKIVLEWFQKHDAEFQLMSWPPNS